MTNTKKEQRNIPDVRYSFYEFAKLYITIKDKKGNEQRFSEIQLNEIKKMKEMMNKGYELKLIFSRRGTEHRWVKKQMKHNGANI